MNHMDCITSVGKLWILNKFEASSAIMHDGNGSTNWKSFDVKQFCTALLGVMSDVSTGNARAMSYPDRIKLFRLDFDRQWVKIEDACFLILRQFDIALAFHVETSDITPKRAVQNCLTSNEFQLVEPFPSCIIAEEASNLFRIQSFPTEVI